MSIKFRSNNLQSIAIRLSFPYHTKQLKTTLQDGRVCPRAPGTAYLPIDRQTEQLTTPTSGLLDDPASTPLGRRKNLKDMAKKTDEEIKAMTPDEIRKAMIQGADLDDNGEPKQKDSSLKIRIELDLEVEVHLTARVQGDVTIGLL
jgi:hypothetical protein